MDFQQAKLDWQDILKDSVSGIYYSQKEWRSLTTDDTSTNISGYHGRITSPTFARKRVIILQGLIQRSGNANEKAAVTYLQNLFNLQADTSVVVPRQLYIKDMYGDEWIIDVKVRDPIDFLEYDQEWKGVAWKWMVTLESTEDPKYYSNTLKQNSGTEGTFGGVKLGVKLPAKLNSTLNFIDCTTIGNTATPARIEITAIGNIDAPLKIINATTGDYFSLNTSAVSWDVIVVDSNTLTATKNGVSIKNLRLPGSLFPMISGTTRFVIEDIDGWVPFSDFTIKIYFRDALLA